MAKKPAPPRPPANREVDVDSAFSKAADDLRDAGAEIDNAIAAARMALEHDHDEVLEMHPVVSAGRNGTMRALTVSTKGGQSWPKVHVFFEFDSKSACMCGIFLEHAPKPAKPTK